jgi:hypothetical protein
MLTIYQRSQETHTSTIAVAEQMAFEKLRNSQYAAIEELA